MMGKTVIIIGKSGQKYKATIDTDDTPEQLVSKAKANYKDWIFIDGGVIKFDNIESIMEG